VSKMPKDKSGRARQASVTRKTRETSVSVTVNLDGAGVFDIKTGVGFFDHMLEQLAKHALIDLTIKAEGDLHIDAHHTVEDTGITLGQAIKQALGDKTGIRRYGHFDLVMDEARSTVALDLSNRPYLIWDVRFSLQRPGRYGHRTLSGVFQRPRPKRRNHTPLRKPLRDKQSPHHRKPVQGLCPRTAYGHGNGSSQHRHTPKHQGRSVNKPTRNACRSLCCRSS
jgi:imidazoleglycerol-phosphate dehydratase